MNATIEQQTHPNMSTSGKWYVSRLDGSRWMYLSRNGDWLPYASRRGDLVGYFATEQAARDVLDRVTEQRPT